ncbi:MAG: M1 family aminopeptidase [Polyangiales bacterium]
MFRAIFGFELRLALRTPMLWTVGASFALLAFLGSTSSQVQVGGAIGNVHRNAPSVVLSFFSVFSLLGLFVFTAFLAQPLLRDFELRTDALFFSAPISRGVYVTGRLAAGVLASMVVYVLVSAGMLLGTAMPWVDPERLGPFSLVPHAWALAVLVLPNLLFAAGLMGLLAVTGRSLLRVYVGVMAFFVLWTSSGFLLKDPRYDVLASLLDPFGTRAIAIVARYWSAEERNTALPALDGLLLWNRLLWLAIGLACHALALRLFRPEPPRRRVRPRVETPSDAAVPTHALRTPTPVSPLLRSLAQLSAQVRFDLRGVFRSVPFLVLLAFGAFNAVMRAMSLDDMWGTPVLPLTGVMLRVLRESYVFLQVVVVGYYAGELVFRERASKLAELTDALPVPSWVPLCAKLATLSLAVLAFMAVGVGTCVLVQLACGYTRLEPLLYLTGALLLAAEYVLFGVAAIFLQVLCNHRYAGLFAYVLLLVAVVALPALGYEHHLYLYAGLPEVPYSDMNGYGHFLRGFGWFALYWSLFAAMLGVIASALWVRGVPPSFAKRIGVAVRTFGRARGVALAALAVAFAATGAFIYQNTNVRNAYASSDGKLDLEAHYERTYRHLRDQPQPRLVDVFMDVDIYPAERRVAAIGRHVVENHHAAPITDLHMFLSTRAEAAYIVVPEAKLVGEDARAGYWHYRLDPPLAPGAKLTYTFSVERAERGFTSDGMPPQDRGITPSPLNENGTMIDSTLLMPELGYAEGRQIVDRDKRRKRGLGDVPRAKKLEDVEARNSIGFWGQADWIRFETTVSTSADQTALAPGYLKRSWVKGDRRYFRYAMDRGMIPYFCYVSARWAVAKDRYEDVDIEVYHHPAHTYNVARMIDATKKSLAYFTANFSPYQHRQVRILEFPSYAQFAQSFANTIPYSEAIGFVADLRDPNDVDYVYYVTAHEVAHQWWAHQVMGADVQGQNALSESLSQYSALMVMEKQYGKAHMRKFLKYELDKYLRGRGGELVEELPLMRVEDQGYIHYNKGSLVFYRLRDEIGEQALNRALAKLIATHAYRSAPYPTTLDLLEVLRAETPAAQHGLLDELFARIVLHDNKVVSATAVRRGDGRWDVTLALALARRESDGRGKVTPLPVDTWAEVGVFARPEGGDEASEKVLSLERHHFTREAPTLTITVDEQPYEAGVDPYNKIIDENTVDNRREVTLPN